MRRVALFSLEQDLHAHAVLHALRQRLSTQCYFVATDTLSVAGGLRWRLDAQEETQLLSQDGAWFDIATLDVIWWRRTNQPQRFQKPVPDRIARNLIENEWRAALVGAMHESFSGIWVNDPARDLIAGNKLYQLKVASDVGFRVPQTLISQDPVTVRSFCRNLGGEVIVKKLVGTPLVPLATVLLSTDQLEDDTSIRMCPSIYQEHIRGRRHVRANCFGDSIFSILIESPWLDWRRDLSVPFAPYRLDHTTELRLRELLRRLGLRMAVVDFILTPSDTPVWLELNTQGQFLFCEGLSGVDLVNPFADFLSSL